MYKHNEIEQKWQKYWDDNKTFKTNNPIFNKEGKTPKKYYVLDMFPYPSWAGLHVWHPEWYTANDIIARYMHAKWFNVLHPMWWDAFGLPAENYAIKTWTHPKVTTEENIQVFKKQIKSLGFSYDWDREIDTTDPKYYKWTQWIFSRLFEEWLAYEQDLPINFCPSCKTWLANEEVLWNGTCERCWTIVEKKKIRQWVLAITKYADRLAKDVEELDWPEWIKDMQRQWIWRSEWCQFDMRKKVEGKPFVLMIHGWAPENYVNSHWQTWLKWELEASGYEVAVPVMPDTNAPDLEKQLDFLEQYKDKINKDSIIIWHSMWAFVAAHFVERLNTKIDKLICVWPVFNGLINHIDWSNDWEGWEVGSKSMSKNYDIEKIKNNTNTFEAVLSKNDKYIPYTITKEYFDNNKIETIVFENAWHFTKEDWYQEFNKLFDLVNNKISVYTTRLDTVFGMTYAVIAPDHKDVYKFINNENREICEKYINDSKNKSDLDRTWTNKDKTWVFTWTYVINPFNNEEVPLWIADYVLWNYWTWAVMAVPAHDERDFEFAEKHNLEIRQSIKEKITDEAWIENNCNTSDWFLINSGSFSELSSKEAREKMLIFAEENWFWEKKVNYKLRDWLFSRQRYWWEPIPLIHIEEKDLEKLTSLNFNKIDIFESTMSWEKTLETRAIKDNDKNNYSKIKSWDILIFNDKTNNQSFLVKALETYKWNNLEAIFNDKNILKKIFPKTEFENLESLKSFYESLKEWYLNKIERNWLVWFEFEFIWKIHDWLYTKIIVDKKLPLELPEVEKYEPSPDWESPLARVPSFVNVKIWNNLEGKRETNTMPQWWGSCWYYLRFMDNENDESLVWKEIENYWWSVDSYVWWAEHAVLHLLYARFWHKFLYDIWVVSTKEPFAKLRNQWLILAYAYRNQNGGLIANDLVEERNEKFYNIENWEELEKIVAKMSKSLKNVVNPDDIVHEYWADALRLYEMYMSDFKDSAPWDTRNIIWVKRFIDKVWNMFKDWKIWENDEESIKLLHKTIKKVWEDIENYKFNTAIASLMILLNYGHPKDENKKKEWLEVFTQLLHPFAPHMAEELWHILWQKESIFFKSWPEYIEELTIDDEIEIAVQVLWKLRWTIHINKDEDKDSVLNKAKENDEVKKWLEWKDIIKEIYVPWKIVNFVIK